MGGGGPTVDLKQATREYINSRIKAEDYLPILQVGFATLGSIHAGTRGGVYSRLGSLTAYTCHFQKPRLKHAGVVVDHMRLQYEQR